MTQKKKPVWIQPRRLSGGETPFGHVPTTSFWPLNILLAVGFLIVWGIGLMSFREWLVHAIRTIGIIPFLVGMAWTNPTTRSTGDVITVAIWNTDVVDNLLYLYTLARHTGAGYESLANSTAKTSVGTYSIDAHAMGAYGMLKAEWFLLFYNNTGGGAQTFTITPYIGSKELFTDTVSVNDTKYGMGRVSLWATNVGHTASQICVGRWSNCTSISAGYENIWTEDDGWYNTAAVDTTSSFSIGTYVTISAADADLWAKLLGSNLVGPFLVTS